MMSHDVLMFEQVRRTTIEQMNYQESTTTECTVFTFQDNIFFKILIHPQMTPGEVEQQPLTLVAARFVILGDAANPVIQFVEVVTRL